METKATLRVVRTRVKYVLVYLKIENATLCSLPWTQVSNCISKGTKATLRVVRTRVKYVLIYLKIENATLCSLLWTQVSNCISKGTI